MLNYRSSNVIEKQSFVDEFEVKSSQEQPAVQETNEDAIAFNSKIKDNFDRIIHYDTYNRTDEIKNREETLNSFISGSNYEVRPSATTMQYKNMPRAEIYQDYREQTAYYTQTKVKSSAKLLMVALTFVVMLLSALVVFNTSLLTSLSATIAQKASEAKALQEQYMELQEELNDVSSDETIIDKATDIGMIKKGE